jgi:hypothetical protein
VRDDQNADYPTTYRTPTALPSWGKAKFAAMMLAGASGWALVALLIYWGVKGF